MSDDDLYENPEALAHWIAEQREQVLWYLKAEKVVHGEIAEEPDYCVAPHAAVWRVMDSKHSNRIAWWVISGDLPTDCVSFNEAQNVREVLGHFGKTWGEVAECMKSGRKHATTTIGPPEKWPELAPPLEERAKILRKIADDDALWDGDVAL